MPVFASNYTFDETLLLGSGYEKSLAMLNDPDAVVAGRYSVDIWLNGRYVGRDDVFARIQQGVPNPVFRRNSGMNRA